MSEREDFWIECDGCGMESGRYGALYKAVFEIKDAGWTVTIGKMFSYPVHYCPECQKRGKVPADNAKAAQP